MAIISRLIFSRKNSQVTQKNLIIKINNMNDIILYVLPM